MEITAYNPNKSRLETLEVQFTAENTTWFSHCGDLISCPLELITDLNGGLLIKALDYSYPVWLSDLSREDINHSQKQAKELIRQNR